MSDVNSSNRLRMIIALVLSLALALGSFWVREVIRRGIDEATTQAARTDPDYFVDNFNFIKTSKTGQARYEVSGSRLNHFPDQDNYEITLPVVKSLNPDRPTVTMVAQRARSNSDASLVEMFDEVHVDRPESALAPLFHLKTDYLQILPDDQAFQTEHAVDITHGAVEMTGEGFYGNNATLIFSLARKVHAVIQSKKH